MLYFTTLIIHLHGVYNRKIKKIQGPVTVILDHEVNLRKVVIDARKKFESYAVRSESEDINHVPRLASGR